MHSRASARSFRKAHLQMLSQQHVVLGPPPHSATRALPQKGRTWQLGPFAGSLATLHIPWCQSQGPEPSAGMCGACAASPCLPKLLRGHCLEKALPGTARYLYWPQAFAQLHSATHANMLLDASAAILAQPRGSKACSARTVETQSPQIQMYQGLGYMFCGRHTHFPMQRVRAGHKHTIGARSDHPSVARS